MRDLDALYALLYGPRRRRPYQDWFGEGPAGGATRAPTAPTASPTTPPQATLWHLLTSGGDNLLTESGDTLDIEHG